MARIIYGVCGEGMGHAIRSKPIIDYLKRKHELVILTSNRSFDYLSKEFDEVIKIDGLHIKYDNNSVDRINTINMNIKKIFDFIDYYKLISKKIEIFKPDIIISDYEFLSVYSALLHKVPLISIDNQHIIRSKISFPKRFYREYLETKIVNRINMPTADHYIVTSFFAPDRKKHSEIIPPILRDSIRNLKTKEKDYILVYQTSDSNKELIRTLKRIDMNFIVSGFNKEKSDKNIRFIKFRENEFLKYLAECKALITNGGFTLISEALYLNKPILSVPVIDQFEQTLNAVYLDRLGYGKYVEMADKKRIDEFIANLPRYKESIKKYKKTDNSKLFSLIDKFINSLKK